MNDNALKKYKDDDQLQIKNIVELKDKNNLTAFYAVNLVEGGYFLIAADDRSHPIMGLVDNGEFVLSENELPQAFLGYLDNEIYGIEKVRESEAEQTKEIETEWDAFLNRIAPGNEPYFCPGEHFTVKTRF